MVWILVIVVLVLLVYSAGFRKFSLGLLVVLFLAGIIWYVIEETENQRSLTRISPQEVELDKLRLTNSSSYSRQLTGRIKNNSPKHTLRSIDLKIILRDCEKESLKESCTIVGETTESIYVNIPPNQARDISEDVYGLESIHLKGEFAWSYRITKLQGE